MKYTFDLVGVSPVIYFFNHQHQSRQNPQRKGVEYLGSYNCTLDAFLKSVETIPSRYGWELDQVVDTVVKFWMHNADSIQYWKYRLTDAGKDNLLVARIADIKGLKAELESLLGNHW